MEPASKQQPVTGNRMMEAVAKSENDLSPELAQSREGNDKSMDDRKPQ